MFICASKTSVRTTVRKASEKRPNWEFERTEAKRPNYRPNHTPLGGYSDVSDMPSICVRMSVRNANRNGWRKIIPSLVRRPKKIPQN